MAYDPYEHDDPWLEEPDTTESGPAVQPGFYDMQALHWQAEAEYFASIGDTEREDACYVWMAFYATLDRQLPEQTERKALLEQFRQFGLLKRTPYPVEKR